MMWRVSRISLFSVAVVGLAIAWIVFSGIDDPPPGPRVRGDFQSINAALHTYKIIAGFYPETNQGLKALMKKPTSGPVPIDWVQLIEKVPTDPWKREYQYRRLAEGAAPGFELRSLGPDGKLHTKDDLSSLD